ncbi:MAG: helix-turn-helix transcriptional regulator [Rhodopirellula sp.]|nr:helix-turn-helix transcriptional regulator [Rhodopirellula sp.]
MTSKRPAKRLAKQATRIVGRLPDEKRAEHDQVIAQVEEELGNRIKTPSAARVALAKLKMARLREGLSLTDVSERTGIDRGNVSRLEQNSENVELNTLVRLADALGYDVVVDLRKRA